MNTRKLIRWAGLSAMVAGICFVAVWLFHPTHSLSSVFTTRWFVLNSVAIVMSVFGLLGITGVYARQADAAGWLGLAGYLLWSLWLVLAFTFAFVKAFLLPLLAIEAPTVAEGFLAIFGRAGGEMKFGALATLWALSDFLFLFGGLVFGIATLRARVLSRWAAGGFLIGLGFAPASALLPDGLKPMVAVPIGLGLAWLGYALWSERRAHASDPVPDTASPQLTYTSAE